MRPTTFRLDDDTRAWLREEAERLGTSENDVARQAIAFYRGWQARERAEAGTDEGDHGGDPGMPT